MTRRQRESRLSGIHWLHERRPSGLPSVGREPKVSLRALGARSFILRQQIPERLPIALGASADNSGASVFLIINNGSAIKRNFKENLNHLPEQGDGAVRLLRNIKDQAKAARRAAGRAAKALPPCRRFQAPAYLTTPKTGISPAHLLP